MSVATVTLEGLALDALINEDHDLAAELVDQLSTDEAQVVYNASTTLAALARRVADGPTRRRHLRAVG
jgi:hypothetical protein